MDNVYIACDMAKPGSIDYFCKVHYKKVNGNIEIVDVEYLEPTHPTTAKDE